MCRCLEMSGEYMYSVCVFVERPEVNYIGVISRSYIPSFSTSSHPFLPTLSLSLIREGKKKEKSVLRS